MYAKKSSAKKILVVLLAAVLLIGVGVGGTLAWLMDDTEAITNTFSTSNIGVTLVETKNDFQMIPGWTIDKDPKATVTAGSVEAYLFVKVVKNGGTTEYPFDSFIAYAIDENWTALDATNYPGVYYMVVDDTTNKIGQAYSILGDGKYIYNDVEYTWDNDEVLTKPEVTKEMMRAISTSTVTKPVELPTLTFTAYASQLYKNNTERFTAAEAWANLNLPATP